MNSPVPTWITNNRTWETWNGKHPFFPGKRHVLRSRRILAERIKRQLQTNEVAHHKDGNTLNDKPSNIALMTNTGHSRYHGTGKSPSEETRRKMSIWQLGKQFSEETRRKIGEAHKRENLSQETFQKLSEWQRGRKLSEETRRKISESSKGRKHSEETRLKISNSLRGRKLSEKHRGKMSESLQGRVLAEKWRQKISKSLQGNTNLLGYRHSIETKRKMSESHQKRAKLDAEIASLQQSLV